METGVMPTRKRPVNLTMNEALVAQAKAYTNNLSATMESLLADFPRWPPQTAPLMATQTAPGRTAKLSTLWPG